MRIFLSCQQSKKQYPVPGYSYWRIHFARGLEEAGWQVEEGAIDWAEGLLPMDSESRRRWLDRTWSAVLAQLRKSPVALFLSYLYPQQIDVGAVAEIHRRGIPCVNFFCDNVREFRRPPKEFSAFDLNWVPEFEALPMYRRAGLAHVHAPMPAWVAPAWRSAPAVEREPPTFIGSADALRRNLLGQALAAGAELRIRGAAWRTEAASAPVGHGIGIKVHNQLALFRARGWRPIAAKLTDQFWSRDAPAIPPQALHAPVSEDEYLRVTREAIVTLGINRVPVTDRPLRWPLRYSRQRDIEAPMLGACYLTEHTEGLASLYEIGREVESYASAEELASKLAALTQDPAHRARLRRAGQQRALAQHTVGASVLKITRILGLAR